MDMLAPFSVVVIICACVLAYCYVERLDHKERLSEIEHGKEGRYSSRPLPREGAWSWTTQTLSFMTVHRAQDGQELFVPFTSIIMVGNIDGHAVLSLLNGSTIPLKESYADVTDAMKGEH